MKTAKGGKVMNPTDAYQKELRKKELKRRLTVRSVSVLKKRKLLSRSMKGKYVKKERLQLCSGFSLLSSYAKSPGAPPPGKPPMSMPLCVLEESALPKTKSKLVPSGTPTPSRPSSTILAQSETSSVTPALKLQSIDDSYMAFLEDMKSLGALDG